ncbi:hypothetical protein RQN30_04750 [Arcanobacterium hippocoleae]
MRIVAERASVRVPASALLYNSAFSGLALSLDFWDETAVTLTTGAAKALILGQGSNELPKDANHLVIKVMMYTLEHLGLPAAGIELVARNNIPRGLGLGEREAEVLAGLLLVKSLLGNPNDFTAAQLARLAADFDVDGSRLAAALTGGG